MSDKIKPIKMEKELRYLGEKIVQLRFEAKNRSGEIRDSIEREALNLTNRLERVKNDFMNASKDKTLWSSAQDKMLEAMEGLRKSIKSINDRLSNL